MVLSPSMSVSLACVNLCKLSNNSNKGEWGNNGGKYECSILSCAWKAPRVLTGSLASTTQPSSSSHQTRKWRRRSGAHHVSKTKFTHSSKSELSLSKRLPSSKFAPHCSSSESYGTMNPESLWAGLKHSISYLSQEELNHVYGALKLAFEAHDGQKRRSGEPFIIHPVEVARILGELELDWESIAAGLLHDTVEDTDLVTFERIEREFGSTVRNIVEGETKVSKLGKIKCKGEISKQDVKADDLRQMFLSMTEEVRVIIVKLADRLHNMRTLSHMPLKKQEAIASETLQVFAPLAKLLGMYQIKAELEFLSFMYTNPSHFTDLSRRVEEFYRLHEKELEEAKRILKENIEKDPYLQFVTTETEVHSACKELYNIYKTRNEVNQIAQLRIIIKPVTREVIGPLCSPQQICYHVLGLVHSIWKPVPQAVKDYIANAKPNGYQSLHTTVIPFLKERSMFHLEILIRTEEMDLIAERGIAAHYSGNPVVFRAQGHKIKQGKGIQFNNTGMALRIGWLNAIREWQEEFLGNMSSTEFLETVTRDLLGSRVFVFTPKGEIKNLPKGATVIDYAYLIHTEIGNKMVSARVNGNAAPPMHELANAEVVEIITTDAPSSKTNYKWRKQLLQHAKTRTARHKIKKFLREHATLSAAEITELEASPEEESKWDKIIKTENLSFIKTQKDLVHVNHCTVSRPKKIYKLNGSGSPDDTGLTELLYKEKMSACKEVLPSLENWKAGKIATWHSVEGNSVNWLCIICDDRKGMMAEVTSALTANGIAIHSCVVETDRIKNLGAMLFHFEGDNVENACLSINTIRGVRGWSVGCSWMNPSDGHLFL